MTFFKVDINKPTILLAILVKFSLGIGLLLAFNGFQISSDFRILLSGDTKGYLNPVENLIENGTWAIDPANVMTYALRPPAYGLVYLPIRIITGSRRAAEFALLALQLLLAVFGAIFFAKTVRLLTSSEVATWVSFVFGLTSFQLLMFDLRLLTESLTVTAVIVSNFLILKDGLRSLKVSWILGFLLMEVVFLRPFLGVIYPAIGLAMILIQRRSLRDIVKHCCAIGLPFAIGCILWSGFNYHRLGGRIIFLQDQLQDIYFQTYRPYTRYIQIIGGDNHYWQPGSTAGWFEGFPHSADYEFPSVAFTDMDCGFERVNTARQLMMEGGLSTYQKLGSPEFARAARILNKCADEFERKHPFDASIVAPMRVFLRYIYLVQLDGINNTSFFRRVMPFRFFFKGQAILLNALFFIGLFSFWLGNTRKDIKLKAAYGVMAIASLLHFAVICAIFRAPEGRYGVMTLWAVYPWGIWAIQSMVQRRGRGKNLL